MEVVNYSEFRKNLKEHLDKASDDAEVVVVSRSKDKNVVVISLDEYNSWMETLHLLKTEANRERLRESIKSLKNKNVIVKNLKDLEANEE
ncbi:MAG: type II toxin-antitoxin system Phd/YefM family antitoxin [Bacteroidia bacterium]|nr:type II toxin-antitoxin system Phd/YefM family antitoxin [Bacteroidia bacterium]